MTKVRNIIGFLFLMYYLPFFADYFAVKYSDDWTVKKCEEWITEQSTIIQLGFGGITNACLDKL